LRTKKQGAPAAFREFSAEKWRAHIRGYVRENRPFPYISRFLWSAPTTFENVVGGVGFDFAIDQSDWRIGVFGCHFFLENATIEQNLKNTPRKKNFSPFLHVFTTQNLLNMGVLCGKHMH